MSSSRTKASAAAPPTRPCSCGRGLPAQFNVNNAHRQRYEDAKPESYRSLPPTGESVCSICEAALLHVNVAHAISAANICPAHLRPGLSENRTSRVLRLVAGLHPYPGQGLTAEERRARNKPPSTATTPDSIQDILKLLEISAKAGTKLAGPPYNRSRETEPPPPKPPPPSHEHPCDIADRTLAEEMGLGPALGILAEGINKKTIPSRHVYLQSLWLVAANLGVQSRRGLRFRDKNCSELLNMIATARYRTVSHAFQILRGGEIVNDEVSSNKLFWKRTNFPFVPTLSPVSKTSKCTALSKVED